MIGNARRVAGVWIAVALLGTGCLSLGEEFPAEKSSQIERGKTTQAEVKAMFGNPMIVGRENGDPTWTYNHAKVGLFRAAEARYMEVKFDSEGVVTSYSVNSTDPADLGP